MFNVNRAFHYGVLTCLTFAPCLLAAPAQNLEERTCCGIAVPILPKPSTSALPAPSGPPTASVALPAGGYWSELQAEVAGVTFNMLYDTGSPRFVVCGFAGDNNPQNIYPLTDAQKSSGKTFSISYDDGTTDSGVEVEDVVKIGGLSIPITLSVSTTCALSLGIDGIMGVREDGDQPTFPQAAAKILQNPTFAMSMSTGYSTIEFGGQPNSLDFENHMKTVLCDESWMISDVSFPVKGGTKTASLQMDTGTSYTFLDPAIVDNYHQQISGANRGKAGNWSIPCGASNLPDLTFTEPNNKGYTHIIPGAAFIGNEQGDGSCTSMMLPTGGEGGSQWFPGWAFWSTHYTWFDTDKKNMQFAQDVSESLALQTSDKLLLQVKQHNIPPPSVANL